MRRTSSLLLCLVLAASLLCLHAFAEEQDNVIFDERLLSGWSAQPDITDKTIIDTELSDYNIAEMPAIRVSEYIDFFNPDTDGSLDIYTEGENSKGAFLLYCEETGTVLWVRHIITDDQTDTLNLVRSYTSDSYPFWLEIALNGLEAKKTIPENAVLQNIMVCNGTYSMYLSEQIIYFYTDLGTYVSVCDEGALEWTEKKDAMFTLPLDEFLPLYADYCKYHKAYFESLPDGYIGSLGASFFVEWMKGTAPEIEKDLSPAVYISIVIALMIAVVAVVAFIVYLRKKRRATANSTTLAGIE